jgi:two-component system sensor histidine kinase KdpD
MAKSTESTDERRPSPKALLELAGKEHTGKLKVFLGAAPGVGKTYAMLSAAQAQKSENVDVVVGLVETHGRAETAVLLDGLEVLARRPVAYRNHTLMEFDVDAALARKPELLLVDEFAHTNAPGSLHAKRYQDVEEILRAGIDVWTTLNIQHLESLGDVVERITGIKIRETVPDKVLERADEIVVVDLPPDELIERLHEGKVYLPENARRAIDQFFKPGNLTALRELALRRTADRVDEKMLAHLRQSAIEGAWPTAERLLVCVGSDELSETVVRTASRMAAALKSPWVALQLQSVEPEAAGRTARRRSEKALRLAERLGADIVRVTGKDMVAEIFRYARRNNITQIVVGRSVSSLLSRLAGRSLSDALIADAKDIAITVIAADQPRNWSWQPPQLPAVATALLTSSVAVVAATLAGVGLSQVTPLPNVSLLYLLGVLGCALRFGTGSAISASILSFLAYNFFFIEPTLTFTVAKPHELVSLFVFLAVAMLTGGLAGRLRERTGAIFERAIETQALYDFSRKLSGAGKLDDVVWALAKQAAQTVKGSSIILLSDGKDLTIRGGWPPEDTLPTPDWAAARWAFKEHQAAGRFTGTMPNARYHFRPLGSSDDPRGVLGVDPGEKDDHLPGATEAALQALSDQAAIALERTLLVEEAAKSEAAAESERLRSALLSSISHDLRTPLSSIVGSVTSLRMLGDRMTREDRADLLSTIEEEATRLSRFVSNLLDMTRLEAGALDIRKDWVDIADAARGAVARAQKGSPGRKIELKLASDLPLIRGDAALLEQVVFNLLDNADKYGGPASITQVKVAHDKDSVELSVTDQGPGIPPDALERVFEKFYRVGHGDGRAPGTGLGLSICQGIIKAMGGTIRAESPVAGGKGTCMIIRLPVPAQAAK